MQQDHLFQQTRNFVRKRRKIESSGRGWYRSAAAEGSLTDSTDDCSGARKAASTAASIIVGKSEIATAKVTAAFPEGFIIGEAWQVGEIFELCTCNLSLLKFVPYLAHM